MIAILHFDIELWNLILRNILFTFKPTDNHTEVTMDQIEPLSCRDLGFLRLG
jgi:hypothetical protein